MMQGKPLTVGFLFFLFPVLLGFSPLVESPASARGGSTPGESAVVQRAGFVRLSDSPWPHLDTERLHLRSEEALVVDGQSGRDLYAKNVDTVTPIASISKLMTAMVLLDSHLPMDTPVTVTEDDVDTLRNSLSRLPVGWTLSREQLLQLALMASENRAANALARTYPGGTAAFVARMNAKAHALGMQHTYFLDPTGLHSENVSTASDLARMVREAYTYPLIRQMTTTERYEVRSSLTGRPRLFGNSNRLMYNDHWSIGLSKTGFINESGFCLVMETSILDRPIFMILLDSQGKYSRLGDAARIRSWLQTAAEGRLPRYRRHSRG